MNVIIGLGTGRCGTVSLSQLLSKQTSCRVTHENQAKQLLPWIVNQQQFNKYCKSILSQSNEYDVIGDVSFYNLPYVNLYLERFPGVKFIVLKRPKEQVVNSYMIKTKKWNNWQKHSNAKNRWFKTFPKYSEDLTKEQALGMYYDDYYKLCDDIIPPESRYDISTASLNNRSACIEMLKFCGFTDPVWSRRHANSNKQLGNT